MIKNYFKTAWRSMARNKVYTVISILGLSIGICACLIIYLITGFELSYDTFHPDTDRIYRIVATVQNKDQANQVASVIYPLPSTMRSELSGFESVALFRNYSAKVTIPQGEKQAEKFDAPENGEFSPVIIAEPQYFDIFKYQWLQGKAATALNEPLKVVLSENEAHKYFGSGPLQNVIGKIVIYNDSLRLTVSGIVKDWDQNTDFGFKDFISFATVAHSFLKSDLNIDMQSWGGWNLFAQGYVKLAKGVTAQQVEKQFPAFVKQHKQAQPGQKYQLSLQPLADVHFNSNYRDGYSRKAHLPTLYGLMGIAAFILTIAAINFINLSTAQSLRRAKEVGVRKVLGGSRTNLTIQFLTETFLVTIAAATIAIIITYPVISIFHSMVPQGLTLKIFDPAVWLFLLSVMVITALLAGFYPARVLSSYMPALSLKGQGTQKFNSKGYLRKSLIVFQFTVSLVFIIGSIVIADQMHYVLNKDLGFNKDAIITVNTNQNDRQGKVEVFENRIKQIPGVEMVTRHMETPMAAFQSGTYILYKGAGEHKVDASFGMCDENYVPLFGLKIIAGRNLFPSDTIKEFLINETCAKALGFAKPSDAIGKLVRDGMGSGLKPIAGVIKDFHSASFHEAITPFFMATSKNEERDISIKLSSSDKGAEGVKNILAQIEKASREVYPDDKFEYHFFDETIAGLYDREQKTSQLMSTAMGVAIFISCMGLFGLATFTAQQRIKEIGIRKVLGASAAGIVSMLSMDFLVLIILAICISSPIAYYFMHQWLQDFAYRIDISWRVFVLSGLAAVLMALLTISFQSVKAALTNPVKNLRTE